MIHLAQETISVAQNVVHVPITAWLVSAHAEAPYRSRKLRSG
jgi:hypothetical protein